MLGFGLREDAKLTDANAASSNRSGSEKGSSAIQAYAPAALFALCLTAQFYLVFFKSFNWDEFIHFSQVYQLKAGTFIQPFQVFHLRMLGWAPDVADNLVNQMRAARVFMWGMNLVTLGAIYGVARQFTNSTNSLFAAFAYLTAGYVFTHGFSIRADPLVTATLMSALFLMARGPLSLAKAMAIGILVGLAGMMTFKAMFYAPCFGGLAWLKFREAERKPDFVRQFVVLMVAAALTFGLAYLFHTSGSAEVAGPARGGMTLSVFLRWLTIELPFRRYIVLEAILAPVFVLCILLAPFAWAAAGFKRDTKVALGGMLAPLAVLLFYRNTFPYFFVFLLAPISVGIAPALGMIRDRYGNLFLAILLSVSPLALAILEPRDVIDRQRALIDYVHREFPQKTGYLDYSGMISDYPRILKYLTSGNGIRLYREQGDAVVARELDRGNLPFIIANQQVIASALEGHPGQETFLPQDLEALKGSYVRQWGVLWREGAQIPVGHRAFKFQLRRDGEFVLAGDPVTVDGVHLAHGDTINLARGPHLVTGSRRGASILWRGSRLPSPPPQIPMDSVFTNY